MNYVQKLIKTTVVAQYDWSAIKQREYQLIWDDGTTQQTFGYDVFEWKIDKLKWGKTKGSSGWGSQSAATPTALKRNNEIKDMLSNNTTQPKPI